MVFLGCFNLVSGGLCILFRSSSVLKGCLTIVAVEM